jgi:DNA-binding MarR family transcriptional regulator
MDTVVGRDLEHTSDLFVAVIEKLLTQRMLDESFEHQVTPSQLVALRFLSLNESSLMSEVAEGLGISFPAATKTIDRLVRKDLAARAEDPHDRRVVRIRLTERGRSLVHEIYRERARRFDLVLDRLDNGARETLHRSMEAFITSAIDDTETVRSVCLHCGSKHHDGCPVRVAYEQLVSKDGPATVEV